MPKNKRNDKTTRYYKLVRDHIPDIISKNGETPVTRIIDTEYFEGALKKKLQEEYQEVLRSTTKEELIEELADMLEVIRTLAKIHNTSLQELIEVANKKAKAKGGFDDRVFLKYVIKHQK